MRIAPDELTYIQEEAWVDIYGKPQPRNTQLRKDPAQYIKPPGDVGIEGSILYGRGAWTLKVS